MEDRQNDEIVYPAQKVNWYMGAITNNADDIESRPLGIQLPAERRSIQEPSRECTEDAKSTKESPPAPTILAVVIENVTDLPHTGSEASYDLSAYYPNEPDHIRTQRRTNAVTAVPSLKNPKLEECIFGQRISLPYNSRQQFVKVGVTRTNAEGQFWVGESCLPIADPAVEELAEYEIVRDLEPCAVMKASVEFISEEVRCQEKSFVEELRCQSFDASDKTDKDQVQITTDGENVASITAHHSREESMSLDGDSPKAICEPPLVDSPIDMSCTQQPVFTPGMAVEIYSTSAGAWVAGTVTTVDKHSITADYGVRRRIINMDTPSWRNLIRHVDSTENGISPGKGDGQPSSDISTGVSKCGVSGPDYTKGQAVQLWSHSQGKWLDGQVEEVFLVASRAENYDVAAGTVKVRAGNAIKWLPPERLNELRKV